MITLTLGEFGGLRCSPPGTLGLLVRETQTGHVLVLSCSHVLARSGHFGLPFPQVPDFWKVAQQPISPTCDPAENRIGALQDGFSTIVPQIQGTNTEDCAQAPIDPAVAAVASQVQSAIG